MAFIGLFEIVLVIVSVLVLSFWKNNREPQSFTNWPVAGMLPSLLSNVSRLHDFCSEIMRENGGTFHFKGPWLPKLDFLITCDPENVHHILSRNFANYGKGREFEEIFEALGDGIFAADFDSWKAQRRVLQAIIKNRKFELYILKIVSKKVQKALLPVFEHFARAGTMVDLQDVFHRFTFDNVSLLIFGFDPNCLTIELPEILYEKAFDELEEAVIYRHVLPARVWKLMKWLEVGEEKRIKIAWDRFDSFLYECIARKQEQMKNRSKIQEEEEGFDLLTAFMVEEEEGGEQLEDFMRTKKFLRDIAFNLMSAGRDTLTSGLTWFFWLVATHPLVEAKILEEIKSNLSDEEGEDGCKQFSIEELTNKFVYLHAAFCETLRMYPPVPINEKAANEADTLPSGHHVDKNRRILVSFYAMARMPEIWGEDCLEFKPERWISEKGGILYVPSYKFSTFNAGPRACLGRGVSFIQLKLVAISVLLRYRVEVVKGHSVSPSNSVILTMRNGLEVRITKRSVT